ncbi:mechanosensitive ion channel family protein [Bauldia litoralis]|uniref:Small-conductance mechanosensitive channel n=1 Tax=Bauldia litoralis TaxID=665467 RepID=A0A1G6D598_9HYPH|nr:mechanosensitive ion channel domain-containing protein [Bauldia litoralis]SDB40298.1 small conductance mechanosensitive channel [Bauldia litoralis]
MDVVEIPSHLGIIASAFWTWAIDFLPKLVSALMIVIFGWLAAKWASRAVGNLIHRTDKIDRTLRPVFTAIVRYSILILVLVAALGQLGVQTTSILAALGGAALAIGLALQGTLTNIASGMMLLWLRPFGIGDYIETENVAGTVEEINLFHTQIRTWDGIFKFVPNSELWNTTLTNYTRNPTRLILIEIGIAYEDDMAEGRRVLVETAQNNANVLKDPPPVVVPLSLGDSAVNLQLRAWATTADFWNTRWELTQQGKRDLEAAGISIPFPQRVIHMAPSDDDAPSLPKPSIEAHEADQAARQGS